MKPYRAIFLDACETSVAFGEAYKSCVREVLIERGGNSPDDVSMQETFLKELIAGLQEEWRQENKWRQDERR